MHILLAHLFLPIEQFRIERTGDRQPRLDPWRLEAEQIPVNFVALLNRRGGVGIGSDAIADGPDIDA